MAGVSLAGYPPVLVGTKLDIKVELISPFADAIQPLVQLFDAAANLVREQRITQAEEE